MNGRSIGPLVLRQFNDVQSRRQPRMDTSSLTPFLSSLLFSPSLLHLQSNKVHLVFSHASPHKRHLADSREFEHGSQPRQSPFSAD